MKKKLCNRCGGSSFIKDRDYVLKVDYMKCMKCGEPYDKSIFQYKEEPVVLTKEQADEGYFLGGGNTVKRFIPPNTIVKCMEYLIEISKTRKVTDTDYGMAAKKFSIGKTTVRYKWSRLNHGTLKLQDSVENLSIELLGVDKLKRKASVKRIKEKGADRVEPLPIEFTTA